MNVQESIQPKYKGTGGIRERNLKRNKELSGCQFCGIKKNLPGGGKDLKIWAKVSKRKPRKAVSSTPTGKKITTERKIKYLWIATFPSRRNLTLSIGMIKTSINEPGSQMCSLSSPLSHEHLQQAQLCKRQLLVPAIPFHLRDPRPQIFGGYSP